MSVHQDIDSAMPHDLINSKPVIASIKEFFGSSQLSQFMDQTNPLSEVTHKRRLSALGPGGLSRERAGFEVRDVHPTHYGRVCPIETPEGPNIGLISSLSCYARINDFGFIETPTRRSRSGRVLDHFQVTPVGRHDVQARADRREEGARGGERAGRARPQAPVRGRALRLLPLGLGGGELRHRAGQRRDATPPAASRRTGSSPGSTASSSPPSATRWTTRTSRPSSSCPVATALIPFLEHDDANRALMGSNMQRQAVPLLKVEAPLVGTGLEADRGPGLRRGRPRQARRDRGPGRLRADHRPRRGERRSGGKEFGADIYPLTKFRRSNQNTCINQKPIVLEGPDASSAARSWPTAPARTRASSRSGRNILVAFMPWRGYNYEDAILVSERLVKDDFFTSIHIQEFDIEARDTKLGPEEITRDIPNVSENGAARPRRVGHHPHRRHRQAGRHPGRQGHAEGRDAADPGGEAPARDLRREGRRRARRLARSARRASRASVVDVKIFSRKGIEKDLRALSDRAGPDRARSRRTPRTRSGSSARKPTRRSATSSSARVSNEPMNDRDGEELVKKGSKFTDEAVAQPLAAAAEAAEVEGRRGAEAVADHRCGARTRRSRS